MRATTTLGIIVCLLLTTVCTKAQTVKDLPVEIKNYNVQVEANGLAAVTTLNIELYNPNAKVLDGEYNFSLQQNQYITGFWLDINGKLREGVITEKQQARVAYENTIRRRIDPGLLEMTAGNNYRVRVYPVPANGSRKIKIVIAGLLAAKENALQYFLPLDVNYNVQHFSAQVTVTGAAETPSVTGGLLDKERFTKQAGVFLLSAEAQNTTLKKPLVFEMALPQAPAVFITGKDCNNSFAVRVKPVTQQKNVTLLSDITVLWDISSSAAKRDIAKELQFLELFCKQRAVKKITVVNFNSIAQPGKDFYLRDGFNSIKKFLQQQQSDGGTMLGSINCNNYKTDAFLLFSDGINNYGNSIVLQDGKPVFCINSAVTADHAALRQIADASGAAYADLSASSITEAMNETIAPKTRLLAVQQNGKKINTSQPLYTGGSWVTISGALYDTASDIILEFGDWTGKKDQQHISLTNAFVIPEAAIATYQLQQAVAVTAGFEQGRQYHTVTAAASFIVLDNLNDYIEYGIEPPAELQDEYKKNSELVRQKAAQKEYQKINEELNNLKLAVGLYNERIAWWGKPNSLISINDVETQSALYAAAPEKIQANNNQVNATNAVMGKANALDEVVVIGYGAQRRQSVTGSVSVINGSQIRSGMTVAQALEGRVPGVMVTQSAGKFGVTDRILIRGNASIGGPEPLYIVNNLPVDADDLNMISSGDIASITVLKDVDAAALYGSRAAGGAIIITLRSGQVNNSSNNGIQKYKIMEDVDYVKELKEAGAAGLYQKYLELKTAHADAAGFYMDAAQLLFENGEKEMAVNVLSNLAEMNNENHQQLRAMGYVLEEWKMYDRAIEVYKKVLLIKEEEPQSYRDLALAYEKNGEYQQAVNLLYKVLTKNFNQYENRYRGLKSLLLNELNAIIAQHKSALDLSKINKAIIEPLPADLRIVIDWNKDETDIDLHVIEPGGEECYYGHKQSAAGGRMSEDFTQGYGPEEYEIKTAQKGKYKIRVNYYGDRYQKQQVPAVLKLTIYKNFGKPDQTMQTESFIMSNQKGIIEIAAVRF